MILYIAMNLKDGKIVLVTDNKVAAEQAIPNKGNGFGEYRVLSTENVVLTSAAQAEVSMSYEEDCVKESVCTALRESGIDEDAHPADFRATCCHHCCRRIPRHAEVRCGRGVCYFRGYEEA